jgi:hypothetical protein
MEGTRYFRRTHQGRQRIFGVDFIEEIRHQDGEVHHYLSMNFFEIVEGEKRALFYADSPHIDRNGVKWFHIHESSSGDVLTQLEITGFEQSVFSPIFSRVSDFIDRPTIISNPLAE